MKVIEKISLSTNESMIDSMIDFLYSENLLQPMTLEEYNAKLQESEEDIAAGRLTSHEDLKKEILTWRK